MGQRGPKPTPTKVLKIRGSWRAKERSNEPKPEGKVPLCPSWLDGKSKALFAVLTRQLAPLGLLTDLDRQALARYCRLSTRWRAMEEFIQTHGETCEIYAMDKQGNTFLAALKLYPQVRVASALAAELLRIENHFGLTPRARMGLQTEKKDPYADADPKARFFRQA